MRTHYAADLISCQKLRNLATHCNAYKAIYSSIFILTKLYNQNSYQNFIHNFLLTIRIKIYTFHIQIISMKEQDLFYLLALKNRRRGRYGKKLHALVIEAVLSFSASGYRRNW
jgi:hypothetical protein